MLSKKIWVALRILVIILLLFGFAVLGVFGGFNYVLSQDSRFDTLKKGLAEGKYKVKADTPGAVTLVIETGDSTSDIAEKLYDQGLIGNYEELVSKMESAVNKCAEDNGAKVSDPMSFCSYGLSGYYDNASCTVDIDADPYTTLSCSGSALYS